MRPEPSQLFEPPTAPWTIVRRGAFWALFLRFVDGPTVSVESGRSWELLVAGVTPDRVPVGPMGVQVRFEGTFLRESPAALVTFIGFLLQMAIEVVFEVRKRGVSLGTFIAIKFLFIRVGGQDVRLECLRLRKVAFAYMAFVWFEVVVCS